MAIVSLRVTHSELQAFCPEIRFQLERRVADIKAQLAPKCGTDPTAMRLVLKDDAQSVLYDNLDDDRPFGYYSPREGYWLHVVDLNPRGTSSWLEDLSQVEKYVMPDEAYDKLENSFRAFKRRMATAKNGRAAQPGAPVEITCDITVGDRCQVDPGEKRGTVRFVGPVAELRAGIWVGVEYDEPVGKHDGSSYFSCAPGFGAFIRPQKIRVGDFPPLDAFDDEI